MTKEMKANDEAMIEIEVKMTLGVLNYLLGLVAQRPIAEAASIHALLQRQGQLALLNARTPAGNEEPEGEPQPEGEKETESEAAAS